MALKKGRPAPAASHGRSGQPARGPALARATPPTGQPALPREWLLLAALSAGLFVTRTHAAKLVGFGDSEALYACYALHPAPAYLDHPGLVGHVARALGAGQAPTPSATHAFTAVLATLVPGVAAACARACGASLRAAAGVGLVALATPMLSIGLFALTPDLLLAPLWLLALGLGVFAAREGDSWRGDLGWLALGLVAGVATWAKASGALLFGVIGAFQLLGPRAARRPFAAWGVLVGLLVASPLALHQATNGFPMLRHRLLDTQTGLPLVRGLGALTIGQLAYLSPVIAWLGVAAMRASYKSRHATEPGERFLALACLVPGAALASFMLASRQAEPHWLGPAWLGAPVLLAVQSAAGADRVRSRSVSTAIAVAALFTVAGHAWVLSPRFLASMPASYEPRFDIANELYGWPRALEAVAEAAEPGDVIVGPHWTICAQLHAGQRNPVGCATPIRDDFDAWLPRAEWARAPRVLFVTDNRFSVNASDVLPGYMRVQERHISIFRGGRRVRVFAITTLERSAHAVR
ncbi:MAG: hypothetical protein IPF92_03660 [Myxococcales bacterium]|nr:hypothetical protein [Myxococcales bacterium]MBL0196640.1 hypothetical protein [Myxococcales bacterium]HQY63192.1 glycosyltransferase family 39 protein [Polyangiaceae bacterium]